MATSLPDMLLPDSCTRSSSLPDSLVVLPKRCSEAEERNTNRQKEKTKLSLFANNIIVYLEMPKRTAGHPFKFIKNRYRNTELNTLMQ